MPTNAKRRRRFESRSNSVVAKRGQRARPRRLGLEALEARQMLSATLVTTASFAAGNVVGNAIPQDSAVLSGSDPSGTLTFTLTAPDGGTVADTETVSATGDGAYNTSNVNVATLVGAYTWAVSYAGDSLNNSATDQGGPDEQVTTVKASPTLVTTASFSAGNVVGSAIPQDSAVLSGGYQESGALVFQLHAPDNSIVDTETVTSSGDGTYSTSNVNVATQIGTYTWAASFAGDGLNNSASDQGGTAEQVTTVLASPSISTSASETASGVVGSAMLSDSVTVSGGDSPTGTVTFTLTAPNGMTSPAGTVTVAGDGTYNAPTVLATQVGTYTWHASYSGDGLNNGAVDNGANESVTTIKASPTISTSASETAGGVVGSAMLSDSVTVSGGDNPTGTVMFTLTAPNGTTSPVGTVTISGDGAYNAPTVLATQVGTYTWHASYGGDGLNNGAVDNGANESVTTIKASPSISTIASAGGTVGSVSVYDTATLAGGYAETGNIVFTLYNSSNVPVFSSTKSASGNGAVISGSFAPTSAGTYHWSATFIGDGNNNGPVSDNGSNESVSMVWANPLPGGTWTPLGHAAPAGIGTMELLTDGTVLATGANGFTSNVWYKLTPDASGSYVNGTWSQLASSNVQRVYTATDVLPDGRVFVLGGEYSGPSNSGNNINSGEIYNPVTNTWTNITPFPEALFGDGSSTLLPDGRVLAAGKRGADTYIYNPATDAWSGPQPKLFGDINDEETWTKLPDGSILTYDIWSNVQEAQRFDPSTMSWIDSGRVPVALDSGGEMGPAVLLSDGRVFQIGATSNTALYTPSTTPGGTGTWAAGPVIPGGLIGSDSCAAMMPNGDVLLAVGTNLAGGGSTKIYEFDPAANSLTDVTSGISAQQMLVLPSGQVLAGNYGSQLYVYTPSGSPQTPWKPTISSVVAKGSNFTLTGTQLNGISAGASFGDDAQMNTNYPIIELKNGSGQVYFARTFNWGTGVATGSTPVSTDFSLPANMPSGTYSLTVIANGIASAPVSFAGGIVGQSADLAVTNNGPTAGTEGTNVTYSLTVTDNGPTNATNVVLTDTLGANLKYVSATSGQGTFSQSGGVVTFSIGSISVGQTVTATVTAESLEIGDLINTASVTSSLSDANPNNNSGVGATVVTDPAIVVTAPITTTSTTLTNQTTATFTHANGVEPTSSFVATINWGDGVSSTGAISLSGTTYTVKGSHSYSQSGTYIITTTVAEAQTGPWSQLANLAPSGTLSTMELLTDGSVMVFTSNSPNNIYKLTPDATGSYARGTWSQLASMNLARVHDATNVLPDGRVLVLGGETTGPNLDTTYTNTGEIYNPLTNTWTNIAPFPEAEFGDDPTMLLPNGKLLAGAKDDANTYIYDPATNTWTAGPTRLFNDPSYHEAWNLLPDGSILSYDKWNNAGETQRLDPTTMTWIDSGSVPVPLQGPGGDLGPAILLADGRVLQLGGIGSVGGVANTALYTPSTTPGGTGTWAAGPMIPSGLGAGPRSSAALLSNGHVLFAAGHVSPHLFEFDPTAPLATSVTDVTPTTPNLSGQMDGPTRIFPIPSGQVLFAGAPTAGELDLYTPSGSPQAASKPTISSVVPKGSNYTLTGTQLNGLSAGASYTDGAEMSSNYPIIELSNGAGKVYFARTFNWSSTGVATGSTPVSTDFSLPANMPYGTYSLTVIAGGIASNPVSFTGGIVGTSADMAVTSTWSSTTTEGSNVTYNLTVTNNGPTNATNVVLTDTLGANLAYVSATKSQGTFSQSGSKVTFSIGSVAVGQTVTATVTAQTLEDGNLTNTASVTSSVSDANLNNNTSVATIAVAEPAITVSGPVVLSGKKQTNVTVATFTHASGIEPSSAFVATITWGDGSTSPGTITQSGTTYTVKGSHTYSANGPYTVTTTVVESGGSQNFAATGLSSTGGAVSSTTTSPADSTSKAPSGGAFDSTSVRDVIFASVTGLRASTAPPTNANDSAGAQLVADIDSLDALFGLLDNSDPDSLFAGTGKRLHS